MTDATRSEQPFEACPHCRHVTCTHCGRDFPHSRNECDANLKADRRPAEPLGPDYIAALRGDNR